jgi:hypothetical protein
MRNPLALGIWLLRFCAAVLAAIWLYQDGAFAASSSLDTVHSSVDQLSAGAFFLLAGAALVGLGLTGRRSRTD